MSYQDYQNARDAAWRILLACGVDRLPVDLNPICRHLGVRTFTYADAVDAVNALGLAERCRQTDGMTFFSGATPIILFNGEQLPQRARFTIAHELGHIILGHVSPGEITAVNREPQPGDAPLETMANQFAARLLAPACVLWALDLHAPDEIAAACRISRQAAEFRAQRMAELYRRNKFLLSPLERAVYQQFLPYITAAGNLHREGEDSPCGP